MKQCKKTMDCLCPGERGVVRRITAPSSMRRRFQDLGLICGAQVSCVFTGRHKDISVYRICGALIAVRNCDAASVYLE